MRADAAVAVAVEGCRVAAGTAVAFAGDQIDERCFLGLLHGSLSSWRVVDRNSVGRARSLGRSRGWCGLAWAGDAMVRGLGPRVAIPGREVWPSIGGQIRLAKREGGI